MYYQPDIVVFPKRKLGRVRRMSLLTSSLACALPELHLAKGALLPPGNQPKVCPDLFLGAVATSENLCSQTSLCPFGYFECLGGNATGSCEESPWALVDIDECHKWCINHPAPPPPLAPAPPGGYSPPPPLEPSDIKSMHHIEDCSSCGVDWCKKVEQGECVSFSLNNGTHALGPSISEVGCDALEDTTPYCIDGSVDIYGVGKPTTRLARSRFARRNTATDISGLVPPASKVPPTLVVSVASNASIKLWARNIRAQPALDFGIVLHHGQRAPWSPLYGVANHTGNRFLLREGRVPAGVDPLDHGFIPKLWFQSQVTDWIEAYDYVWMVDEDMSFHADFVRRSQPLTPSHLRPLTALRPVGQSYPEFWRRHQEDFPQGPPLVAQPTIRQNTQFWALLTNTEVFSPHPTASGSTSLATTITPTSPPPRPAGVPL